MARNTASLEMSSDLQRKLLEQSKISLLSSFDELEKECEIEGTKLYHPNQEATATEVANTILNDPAVVFQLVKAMTQTGKTGCMLAVIRSCFTLAGCDIKVNPKNIFIITGISSTDWKEQTKKRFPTALKDNIYHRGELAKKLKIRLTGLRDVVILMDEVHIASKDEMTMSNLLQQTGLRDKDYLRENNINFIEFSATPNKVMEDMSLWKGYARQHVMLPGIGYKGVHHQLVNGRAFQAKDLFINFDADRSSMTEVEYTKRLEHIQPALAAISEIKQKIVEFYDGPRYHIIRLPTGAKFDTVVRRFKNIFGDDFYHAPCHTRAKENDVQSLIKDIPTKHTLIYIKDHLRCAVTLDPKENVGILYERVSDNDDVMIQGLSGRATGYDVPDNMLVYTKIASLERYKAVWDSGFADMKDFTYHGSRMKSPKPTVFHPTVFGNSGIEIREPLPVVGSEENFVFDLSDEDIVALTPTVKVAAKHRMSAMGIIMRESPEKWEKYRDYKPRLWAGAEKEANYKGWAIASLLAPGSRSTTTNVTKADHTKNVIKMYVNSATKQLIVSPWSGEPKPPTPEMSGGAAEAD